MDSLGRSPERVNFQCRVLKLKNIKDRCDSGWTVKIAQHNKEDRRKTIWCLAGNFEKAIQVEHVSR